LLVQSRGKAPPVGLRQHV